MDKHGAYKFFRVYRTILYMAAIEIILEQNDKWDVVWDIPDTYVPKIYDAAARLGLDFIIQEYARRGGQQPYLVRIVYLFETVVDTRDDVVKCTSAMAVWLALGYSENELNIFFNNNKNEWVITLKD